MAAPYFTITDKNSIPYSFPVAFEMESQIDENSSNIVNTSYAAGGRDISDKFPRAKTVTLVGNIQGDTPAAFETKKRAFVLACLKGGDLRFTGDTVSRYLEVKHVEFSWGKPEGADGWQYIDVSVTFSAEKVFWKANSESTDSQAVTGNDTLTVDGTGSDFLVKPVITITNAADNPGIKMINTTDSSMSFTYNDSAFYNGDVLEIDCARGTVKKNGNNTIAYFDGAFLRLQPESNTIQYEGAAATILFTWRKVYI